jgi:hypothetical protein
MANESQKTTTVSSYALIAIVAGLGLFGIVVVTVAVTIPLQQQAEAAPGCEKGLPQSAPAFNASKGRCFRP